MKVIEAERLADLLNWLVNHKFDYSYFHDYQDDKEDGASFKVRIWLTPKKKGKEKE